MQANQRHRGFSADQFSSNGSNLSLPRAFEYGRQLSPVIEVPSPTASGAGTPLDSPTNTLRSFDSKDSRLGLFDFRSPGNSPRSSETGATERSESIDGSEASHEGRSPPQLEEALTPSAPASPSNVETPTSEYRIQIVEVGPTEEAATPTAGGGSAAAAAHEPGLSPPDQGLGRQVSPESYQLQEQSMDELVRIDGEAVEGSAVLSPRWRSDEEVPLEGAEADREVEEVAAIEALRRASSHASDAFKAETLADDGEAFLGTEHEAAPEATQHCLSLSGAAKLWMLLWLVAVLMPLVAAALPVFPQMVSYDKAEFAAQVAQLSATVAATCLGLLSWRWFRMLQAKGFSIDLVAAQLSAASGASCAGSRDDRGGGPDAGSGACVGKSCGSSEPPPLPRERWQIQRSNSSNTSLTSCSNFSHRRGPLMKRAETDRDGSNYRSVSKDTALSTPMVLELELPMMAGSGGSASSMAPPVSLDKASALHGVAGRVALAPLNRSAESLSVGEGVDRRVSFSSAECDLLVGCGDGEEIVKAEVTEVDGQTSKLRIEFKSKCIRTQNVWQRKLLNEQQTLLQALKNELEDARRELRARDEIREEQKELLRGFRKIVTREVFDPKVMGNSHRVTVFVVEELPTLSEEMTALCRDLNYECQSFRDPGEFLEYARESLRKAASMATESPTLATASQAGGARGRWKALASKAKPKQRFQDTVLTALKAAREARRMARVVFLGASLLDRLPPEWENEDMFVALTSEPEDYETVGRSLLATGDTEMRERLRKMGIQEYLLHPVSMEAFTGVIREGVRRHFADEYLLMKQLGRGAFGVVYQAKRLRDGEIFALKEINVRRLGTTDASIVKAEAELLRELRWPTVLFLVDFWSNSGDQLYYLLMPIFEGGSLQARMEEASKAAGNDAITLDRILEWYSQTLHGVSYLHWQGIIHRDLKPENLLLGIGGQALRIADLGSAERLPGAAPHPKPNCPVHGAVTTPMYASPEVRSSETYYSASDCWSVGVTFYQVATVQPGKSLPGEQGTIVQPAGRFNSSSFASSGAGGAVSASSYVSNPLRRGESHQSGSGAFNSNSFSSNARRERKQPTGTTFEEVVQADVSQDRVHAAISAATLARARKKCVRSRESCTSGPDADLEQASPGESSEPNEETRVFSEELSRLLRRDPAQRAGAAELIGRDSTIERLQSILSAVGCFPESALKVAHFKELERMLQDAAIAKHMDGSVKAPRGQAAGPAATGSEVPGGDAAESEPADLRAAEGAQLAPRSFKLQRQGSAESVRSALEHPRLSPSPLPSAADAAAATVAGADERPERPGRQKVVAMSVQEDDEDEQPIVLRRGLSQKSLPQAALRRSNTPKSVRSQADSNHSRAESKSSGSVRIEL